MSISFGFAPAEVQTWNEVDSDGYTTGLALNESKYAEEGTSIGITAMTKDKKAADSMKIGDRIPTIDRATVLSRFPSKKK